MNTDNRSFIPGPLHPDLFGGETPVMVPVPDHSATCFRVEVCWEALPPENPSVEGATFTVVAGDPHEAARIAVRMAAARHRGRGFDAVEVHRLGHRRADNESQGRMRTRGGVR